MAQQVKVRYRSQLAELTGIAEERLEAGTVKDILKSIGDRFGREAEKKAKTMLIVVNSESILQLRHFKSVLRDGDEVSFLPICGGG